MKKRLLALLLALCLCGGPWLAPRVSGAAAAAVPEWMKPFWADAVAMKLTEGEEATLSLPISIQRLRGLAEDVADKLSLLDPGAERLEPMAVEGNTRGDVVYALYDALRWVRARGYDTEPVDAFLSLGVLRGDGTDLALERTCTLGEALVMAVRLIWAEYDATNAGSRGLFWKVTHGENTLYLLGTAHLDRGALYPFHYALREALAQSEEVALELDLNDREQIRDFAALQVYSDGTNLRDHISEELYRRTRVVCVVLGISERAMAQYKPWALANSLSSIISDGEDRSEEPMVIDAYVNAAAVNRGIPVVGVETYAFQGGIFDSLSSAYQEAYLESSVALVEASFDGDTGDKAALDRTNAAFDQLVWAWRTGNLPGFAQCYNKQAILNSGDELNAKLFTDRDPGMVRKAVEYLELPGSHVNFMAVGAGHMVAPGGIIPELEALGYQVEQMTYTPRAPQT